MLYHEQSFVKVANLPVAEITFVFLDSASLLSSYLAEDISFKTFLTARQLSPPAGDRCMKTNRLLFLAIVPELVHVKGVTLVIRNNEYRRIRSFVDKFIDI